MKQIVLIEDDKLILRIIAFLLEKEGYTIFTAYDGNEGLELINKIKPDLILTDIMLTYKSGLEVTAIAKKLHPTIPIIVLSALGKEEKNIQKAIKLGIAGFITKPFKPNELLELVKKTLNNNITAAYSICEDKKVG